MKRGKFKTVALSTLSSYLNQVKERIKDRVLLDDFEMFHPRLKIKHVTEKVHYLLINADKFIILHVLATFTVTTLST